MFVGICEKDLMERLGVAGKIIVTYEGVGLYPPEAGSNLASLRRLPDRRQAAKQSRGKRTRLLRRHGSRNDMPQNLYLLYVSAAYPQI